MWGEAGDFHWYRIPEIPGIRPWDAHDISKSGKFIVGTSSHVWQLDEDGYYAPLPLRYFELNDHVVDHPDWRGVEADAQGNVYFAGEYFDLNTFVTRVGFWNQDGDYLGTIGGATTFRDFAVVSGEVMALVTGLDDAFLVRMSDGASNSMKQLTGRAAGYPCCYGDVRGLFEGEDELGMLLNDEDGSFYTVFDTAPEESPFYDLHFDFNGDGVIDQVVPSTGESTVTYQYDQPGVYQATVSVRDSEGEEIAQGSVEVVISSEWRFDVTLNTTASLQTPGSIVPLDSDPPVKVFHEWQSVSAEVWVTLVEELPAETSDFQFAIDINPGLYVVSGWTSHLGDSAGAATALEGERPQILATLSGVDLSGYALGDRILVGTLLLVPDASSPVGVPVEASPFGYVEPFDHADLQIADATVDGGATLAFTPEIQGLWVPVPYDLDDDGRVGLSDFSKFVTAFGLAGGTPSRAAADFDRNGVVGLSDFALFVSHFGRIKGQDESVRLPEYRFFNESLQGNTLRQTLSSSTDESSSGLLLEGEPLLEQTSTSLRPNGTRPAEAQGKRLSLAEPIVNSSVPLSNLDPRLIDQLLQRFESPADSTEWEAWLLDSSFETDWRPIQQSIDSTPMRHATG